MFPEHRIAEPIRDEKEMRLGNPILGDGMEPWFLVVKTFVGILMETDREKESRKPNGNLQLRFIDS